MSGRTSEQNWRTTSPRRRRIVRRILRWYQLVRRPKPLAMIDELFLMTIPSPSIPITTIYDFNEIHTISALSCANEDNPLIARDSSVEARGTNFTVCGERCFLP